MDPLSRRDLEPLQTSVLPEKGNEIPLQIAFGVDLIAVAFQSRYNRWCQPMHGAYQHLVTEPSNRLLLNCGTVFRWRSETFRHSHLFNELSKHTFLRELLVDLSLSLIHI